MKQDKTRRRRQTGQAAVECALALPVLLLLIVNTVNFGTYLFAWISVANAARTGAQYATTGGVSLGGGSPSAATVQTMVVDDLKGLPNYSATQVCVSASNSATVSCNTGSAPAGTPPAVDTAEGSPSAITYVIGAVDVTYTYSPLIPIWRFATLPASSVHRQARMRILQ